VTNSDLLLINKTDLISDDLLKETIILVTTLNPVAPIFPTQFCSAKLPAISEHRVGEHHHFRADLDSISLTISGEVPYSVLSDLPSLLDQNHLGDIVRAKGILLTEQGWESFDYVNGRWNLASYPGTLDTGKAVFIGKSLKKPLLAELFSV
jgi:G3E family GTPase